MSFINLQPRFLLALLVLMFTLSACSKPSSQADTHFMDLANDYLDHYYLPVNPSQATSLGVHQYDDQIEDFSQTALQNNIKRLKDYEAKLNAVNPQDLSEAIQGDRDLVLNNIRSQLLTLEKIQPSKKNPDLYSSTITNDAFVIMERRYAPADERLRHLIAREKQMPALLAEARKNLQNPPQIYTQIALEQVPGMIRFFQQDVPAAFREVTDPDLQKQFAASNAAVVSALQAYQNWLKTDLLPLSHGDFRLGKTVYRQKLLYDEMVDLPLEQLIALGMANLRQNQQELAQVSKEIDPGKTPRQLLASIGADHPAPDQLLDRFRGSLEQLVQFIQEKNIITIPSKVRPILEETPPFLRAITFASMDIPGPFENAANEAYFNVTLPDKTWKPERIKEFMTEFNYPVISSVSVHEAYPGHYVQFLWLRQNDDRVRKVFGAASNAEGWAHYCEQMMLDEGLGQDKGKAEARLLRLGYLQEALMRNARYLVSINMHAGHMSFNQALDFFQKEGYQTKAVSLVETKRGTMDPTYLYYTLGKLEILKLRADLEKKEGSAFQLKQFHNDFMQQGFPPIKIVRKAMLGDDSAVL